MILLKTPDSEGDIFAKGLLNGGLTGPACGDTNQCEACGAGCVEAACLPAAEGSFLKVILPITWFNSHDIV